MDVIYKYYLYYPGNQSEVEEVWAMVKIIAYSVIQDWRKPDKGIWEIRGEDQHFVFSKVMCWVALDRAVAVACMLPAGIRKRNRSGKMFYRRAGKRN